MPKKKKSDLMGTLNARRKRLRRKNETEEERRQRLDRHRLSASIRRANESEEKRHERLARNRHVSFLRAKKAKKERQQKLAMQREAALSRHENESKEEYRQRLAELIDYAWSDSATESEKKFYQRRYVSFCRAKKSKVQHSRRNTNSSVNQSKRNLWKFTGTKRQVNQSRFTIRSKISLLPSVEFSRDWTAPHTVDGQKASATKTNFFNSCKAMNYSLSSVIDCPPPEGEIAIVESYSSPVKDEFDTDNFETYIGPPNPLHEQNVNVPPCREIKQEPAFEDSPILTKDTVLRMKRVQSLSLTATGSCVSQFKGNLWNFSGTKRQVNRNPNSTRSKIISSLPSVEFSRDWTAPHTVYGQKVSATKTNLFNNSCKAPNYFLSSVIDCPPPKEEIAIVESYSSPVKDEFETDHFETYIGPPNHQHEQNVNVPACREIKREPAFEDLPILTPSECFRIAEQMQEDNRYLLPEVVEEYCDDEISFEPCDNDKSSSPPSVTSEDRTYKLIDRSRMTKEKYFPPCLETTRN